MARYGIDFIRKRATIILVKRGMKEKDAAIFVDSMLSADMCSVSTHGIRMLPQYIQKLDQGGFSFEEPVVIKQLPAFTILDAKNNIGAVAAMSAVAIAQRQAETEGVHTVFCRNANTFGPGFYYVEKLAEKGLIGLICCNAPAAMPAYNGMEVLLGTNPIAFALPTKSHGNIILDIATSVVSKSRFGTAKAKGEQLEPGWALDKDGNPTTDPDEGIQGFVLPMAGFKGYGIAMVIDIMSGLISGAAYLDRVNKFYSKDGACMNVGYVVAAFNPALIFDGDFWGEADNYVERLRSSKCLPGEQIVIPGDRRRASREKAMAMGVELTEDVVEKLEQLFGEKLELSRGVQP